MRDRSWRRLGAVLDDVSWSEGAGPPPLQLALTTFAILGLELALIRWLSGQIRLFAYFNNLLLICAFLGMGLGLALGRRRPGLVHMALPALAILALVVGFAEPLGLVRLRFPDSTVLLWEAEAASTEGLLVGISRLVTFLGLLPAVVIVFLCAAAPAGYLFGRMNALKAYRWDLLGSLLGVGALTAVCATGAPPPVWLALGVLPLAWLSRRPSSWICAAAVIALGALSVKGAVFSPYNRIDVAREGGNVRLEVNRDFHQYMYDLSDAAVARGQRAARGASDVRVTRAAYDLPFTVNEHRGSALVVGAGSGNDAQAALRAGYRSVTSVDIDGSILALGLRLHPERPYGNPRVRLVNDDARAFFRQDEHLYDAVVFGLLDSHAMFTSLSSLRLDNYVYTEEGIRAAWEHVSRDGHLSVSFCIYGGTWIADRLYWTIARATGREPVALLTEEQYGCTFVVPRSGTLPSLETSAFGRYAPASAPPGVKTTSDDWPFLYIRPGRIPFGYISVLLLVVVAAFVTVPIAYGSFDVGGFDPVLFLMGAAFLLIETRGVTALSLLFGSTWIVNACVFAGVLVMALVANEIVARRQPRRIGPWIAALLGSVVLLWAFPMSALAPLSPVARGLAGGLVNGLPVGFAGVIVSMLLSRAKDAPAALGSNLIGSVVGGCLEYLSMAIGLRSLVLIALVFYVVAVAMVARSWNRPRMESTA